MVKDMGFVQHSNPSQMENDKDWLAAPTNSTSLTYSNSTRIFGYDDETVEVNSSAVKSLKFSPIYV